MHMASGTSPTAWRDPQSAQCVCVWPVPGSSPNPARSQDTVALPGTRHTQHGARRPCSHRLLRRWCAVSSRRENVFLAFGEHFSFLFHLNKPPATFQNRTKKGQGQGAAEVSHLCETAPQCASPGLWVDGHGGSLGWRCPARSAVRFHLGSGDGDRVREWAGLPLLVCGPRGGEPAGPGQRRPRRPRGAGVGAETGRDGQPQGGGPDSGARCRPCRGAPATPRGRPSGLWLLLRAAHWALCARLRSPSVQGQGPLWTTALRVSPRQPSLHSEPPNGVGLPLVFTKSWCRPLKNPVHRGAEILSCDMRNFPFGCPSRPPGNPVLNIKVAVALLRAGPWRWAGGGVPAAPTWTPVLLWGPHARASLLQGTFCPGRPLCVTVTWANPAFPAMAPGFDLGQLSFLGDTPGLPRPRATPGVTWSSPREAGWGGGVAPSG